MDTHLTETWEKSINIIKGELTEVSFNTWIKSINPISLENNSLKLAVPNDFTKGILESRYKDLIVNALKLLTSKKYNIDFIVTTEEKIEETNKKIEKSNIVVNDEMSTMLNPKYTFDSFVIGNSNRFAHAASLAVAEAPC